MKPLGRQRDNIDFAKPRGNRPHIVPRDRFYCEESWSEWQDLNLRPPRPERGTDHRTRYGNSAYAPYSSRRVKLPMSFPIRISGKRGRSPNQLSL
jgi:hypothetical protein